MKLDIIDIQDEEYNKTDKYGNWDEPEGDMPYVAPKRTKRKRKRRNMVFTILGLTVCFILMVAVMYLAMVILEKAGEADIEDAMAEVMYTQLELDEKLKEADAEFQNQLQLAIDTTEEEILGGIKQSLQSGVSTVETLRAFYPDDLVLASGGQYHFVPINDALKQNEYADTNLNILENGEFQYVENGQVVSHKGIDVSKHQGDINWQKVAEDGVEFAFIRAALRGYGTGKLVEDERFEENIKGAISAGIKVGVYVYSQAITEEEVLEEANYILQLIAPYKIDCPVVFDVEMVSGDNGRMNNLTVEERTHLTALFCETIQNAGYKPMIYHNMEMGALKIDLTALEDYDKWFAYYNANFYYPYEYDVWQYSEKGRVNGIKGDVDMNISFVPLWE
uniref:glycoside hydrolase family 25 protein n=1 Tax=Acetatifactor sp. TaxID=1872090 RepID=UPI0040575BDA